jgi:uncharacterized repeat protein (TIGR02543 family)
MRFKVKYPRKLLIFSLAFVFVISVLAAAFTLNQQSHQIFPEANAGTSTNTRVFSYDWWLRTPGNICISYFCLASYVSSGGTVISDGGNVTYSNGVRPALFLNLSSLTGYKTDIQVGTCDSSTDDGKNCIRFGSYAFDIIGINNAGAKSGICTLANTDGYTDDTAECPNNTLALLLSNASGSKFSNSVFRSSNNTTANNYYDSNLNTAMNGAYSTVSSQTLQPFGPALSSMIRTRNLAGGASNTANGGNKCAGTAPGARSFFPLSATEASALYTGSGGTPPSIPLATAPAQPGAITTWSAAPNTTTNAGNVSYSYAFTAGGDGGAAITSYKYCMSTASSCTPGTTLPSGTTTSGTIANQAYNVANYFCVAAVNTVGTGTARCSGSAVRGYTIPAAISNGAAYVSNTHAAPKINITKGALSADAALGGNGATFSKYQYSTNNGTNWVDAPSGSWTWATTSIQISNQSNGGALQPNTAYTVCLRVSNTQSGAANYSAKQGTCPSVTTGKLTVQFDKNDAAATGTMPSQVFNTNASAALTPNAFAKLGYHFTGWAASSAGAATYLDSASISPSATEFTNDTVTLYAKWTPDTVSVSFNLDGGVCSDGSTGSFGPISKAYDQSIAVADMIDGSINCSAPTKVGAGGTYVFDGFYTPPLAKWTFGSSTLTSATGMAGPAANVWTLTLTAKYRWDSAVTYHNGVVDNSARGAQFGSSDAFSVAPISPQNYALRTSIPEAPASCVQGAYQTCRFNGWKLETTDPALNNQIKAPGFTFTPLSGFTYDAVAQWTAFSVATVDATKGPSTGGDTIYITGTNLSPDPARVGVTFPDNATILVGGSACTNINIISASAITCETSAHSVSSLQTAEVIFDWGASAGVSPGSATSRYAKAKLDDAYDYTHTVDFNCNQNALRTLGATAGGVGDAGQETCTNATATQIYNSPGDKTLPAASIFTSGTNMTGIEFLGWSSNPSASTPTWQDADTYTVSSAATGHADAVLYAIWGKKAYTATITNSKYKYTQVPPLTPATINTTPAGNVTGGVSSTTSTSQVTASLATFAIGDVLTLTANPVPGYSFTAWSFMNNVASAQTYSDLACASGLDVNPCAITITADNVALMNAASLHNIQANYDPIKYLLTLKPSLHLSGYCSDSLYNDDQSGCLGAGGSWQSVSAVNRGSVSGSAPTASPSTTFTDTPDVRQVEYGDTVTIVCTAGALENCDDFNVNYQLGSVVLDLDGVGNSASKTLTLQMPNLQLDIEPGFIYLPYELTLLTNPAFGANTWADNGVSSARHYIDIGRSVDITATPAPGFVFDDWEIVACTDDAGDAITPVSNCASTANFDDSGDSSTTLNLTLSGHVSVRANFSPMTQDVKYVYTIDNPSDNQLTGTALETVSTVTESLQYINSTYNAAADLNTGYSLLGWKVTAPATSPLYGKYFVYNSSCSGITDGLGTKDGSSFANALCAFSMPHDDSRELTLTAQYQALSSPIRYYSDGRAYLGSFGSSNLSGQVSACNRAFELATLPSNTTATTGAEFSISTTVPTCLGYTFLGWDVAYKYDSATDAETLDPATGVTQSAPILAEDENNIYRMPKLVSVEGFVMISARWAANAHTVTFAVDTPALQHLPSSCTSYSSYTGELISVHNNSVCLPYQAGYTFRDYRLTNTAGATLQDTSGSDLDSIGDGAGLILPPIGDTEYKLIANFNIKTYTVHYDLNCDQIDMLGCENATGTMLDSTYTFNAAANLTTNTYAIPGYTFMGWSLAEGFANSVDYANGTSYKFERTTGDPSPEADEVTNQSLMEGTWDLHGFGDTLTLYANWESDAITMTFYSNLPSLASSIVQGVEVAGQAAVFNSAVVMPANTWTIRGWEFDHWNPQPDDSGTNFATGSVYWMTDPNVSDVPMYAIWRQKDVAINWHNAYGNTCSSTQVYDNSWNPTCASGVPTRIGYNFMGYNVSNTTWESASGWLTTPTGSGASGAGGVAAALKLNIANVAQILTSESSPSLHVYMIWEQYLRASVSLNGGAAPAQASTSYPFDTARLDRFSPMQPLTLSSEAPTRPSFEFRGWDVLRADTNALHAHVASGGTFNFPGSNVLVSAKWRYSGPGGVCIIDSVAHPEYTTPEECEGGGGDWGPGGDPTRPVILNYINNPYNSSCTNAIEEKMVQVNTGQLVRIDEPNPICDQFDFIGWFVQEIAPKEAYATGATFITPTSNPAELYLYPLWQKAVDVPVTPPVLPPPGNAGPNPDGGVCVVNGQRVDAATREECENAEPPGIWHPDYNPGVCVDPSTGLEMPYDNIEDCVDNGGVWTPDPNGPGSAGYCINPATGETLPFDNALDCLNGGGEWVPDQPDPGIPPGTPGAPGVCVVDGESIPILDQETCEDILSGGDGSGNGGGVCVPDNGEGNREFCENNLPPGVWHPDYQPGRCIDPATGAPLPFGNLQDCLDGGGVWVPEEPGGWYDGPNDPHGCPADYVLATDGLCYPISRYQPDPPVVPPVDGECEAGFTLLDGLCYRDSTALPPAPANPTDPSTPKDPNVNPPEFLEPSCSDTQYTDQADCESGGGIWDGAGSCSDPQYTTQAECEGALPPGVWTPDPNPDYNPNLPPGALFCDPGYVLTDDLKCHNINDLPPLPHQCRVDHVWDASIQICVERGSNIGTYQPKIDANPKVLYRRDDLTTNTLSPNHFKPDIDLHLYLHSDPLHLGYAHSHETEGSFTATHQVPNEAQAGDHNVVATAAEFEYDTLLHAQAAAKVNISIIQRAPQAGECLINGVFAPQYTNQADCEHAGGSWAPEPGFCYVGDTYSPQYTTREDCEAAGGKWLTGDEHAARQGGECVDAQGVLHPEYKDRASCEAAGFIWRLRGISPTGIYVTSLLILIASMLILAGLVRRRKRRRA